MFCRTTQNEEKKRELYSWLLVNTIPVLVEEKKIERQSKIETLLNLYQITREHTPKNQKTATTQAHQ
jgi:hypothetical protein